MARYIDSKLCTLASPAPCTSFSKLPSAERLACHRHAACCCWLECFPAACCCCCCYCLVARHFLTHSSENSSWKSLRALALIRAALLVREKTETHGRPAGPVVLVTMNILWFELVMHPGSEIGLIQSSGSFSVVFSI